MHTSTSPSSFQETPSQETIRFVRTAAISCITGSFIAAAGASITAILLSNTSITSVSAPYTPAVFVITQILWAISYALIIFGLVGVARINAVGSSTLGKIGLWLAILGKIVLIVGNLGFAFFATASRTDSSFAFLDALMGIGTVLTAIGLLLAGIAILQAKRWHGWHRYITLICGLFVFVVLLPILSLELVVIEWPIAGWAVCFVLLGIALYQEVANVATPNAMESDMVRPTAMPSQDMRSASGS